MRRTLSAVLVLGVLVAALFTVAGCGKNLSGTYVGDTVAGALTIEFKPGGKALGSFNGQTRQIKYTVDGDRVIFDSGDVYTIQKDGSLSSGTGPMSITLRKK